MSRVLLASLAALATPACRAPKDAPICSSWKCAKGTVSLEASQPDALSGRYVPAPGAQPILFSTRSLPDGSQEPKGRAQAVFELAGRRAIVALTGPEEARLTWEGVELDGKGALDAKEEAALGSLAQSPIAPALAAVPLALGCRADVPPAHLAALLFPWQLLLKYAPSPDEGIPSVPAVAARSQCGYFGQRFDDRPGQLMGPLRLSSSHAFPDVFGYFPFDAQGATDEPNEEAR